MAPLFEPANNRRPRGFLVTSEWVSSAAATVFSIVNFRFRSRILDLIFRLLNCEMGYSSSVSKPEEALYSSLEQVESGDRETCRIDVVVATPPIVVSFFSSLKSWKSNKNQVIIFYG